MSKSLPMTSEQAMATNPTDSVWVTASAGTGKTHVLSARVLRLLVQGTAPNKILCLTYTKAAANEMKTRIFEELGKWTGLSDEKLSREINIRTAEKADQKMLLRARSLFAHVLDVPGGMNIQTIHSFCQSLLGRFPAEAALTPHFQVMDERTTEEFLETARDQVLFEAQKNQDETLLDAVERIASRKNEDQFQELLKSLSSERRHFKKLLTVHGSLEKLIEVCAQTLGVKNGQSSDGYLKENLADTTLNLDQLKTLANCFADGSPTEVKYAQTLSEFINSNQRELLFSDLFTVVLTQKLEPAKRCPSKGLLEKHGNILEQLDEYRAWLLKLAYGLKNIEAFENTKAVLQLSDAIIKRFSKNKRRQSLMDYDDLIFKTDQLLSQPHIAPWVLYKLDGGIDHILVDEAQDTNPEQWNMVETLSEEFFATASDYKNIRSVFAVGDTKQSIFSFQRADPVAFQQAKERIKGRVENAKFSFLSVGLHRSFRSTRPVLELTDQVFALDKAGKNLTPENELIRHQTFRGEDAGLVELWPTTSPDQQGYPDSWQAPTEQQRAQTAEGHLAIRIADKIEAMIKAQEILKSQDRPIMARDIMVLVRRRKDFSNHLIRALKFRGIDVAGSDRMVLSQQLAVMDLMALANFALLPDDNLTLATVLKSPLVGINEEVLFTIAYDRADKSLWQVLNRHKTENSYAPAYKFLSKVLAEADFSTPFQFFSKILNQGGRKKIISRLGLDAGDAIDELLALAMQYEHLHKPSLQGFVHWMSNDEGEIKRDMDLGRDEVRIMTVHGAKGLQAPIVFLPDTCQTPAGRGEKLLKVEQESKIKDRPTPEILYWSGGAENEVGVLEAAKMLNKEKQDAEYRRLLYVAMTRAQDRLYVAGWETSRKRPENCWYNLIADGFSGLDKVEEITTQWPEQGQEQGQGQEEVILRYSSEQEKTPEIEASEKVLGASIEELPQWIHHNAPDEVNSLRRPLTPSESIDNEPALSPITETETSPFLRGNLIHKLLETLPSVPMADRQEIALKYLNKPAHKLKGESSEDIWQKIEGILNHEKFAPLFAEDSRGEVSLTGVIGKNVINAQIDRLKVTSSEVLIIDYKTNRPPPKGISKVPASYLRQMALYSALVAKIYPEKKIISALLWTQEGRIMRLPNETLNKHMP